MERQPFLPSEQHEWYFVLAAHGITEGVEIRGYRILKLKLTVLTKPKVIVKDLSTGGEVVYLLQDFLAYVGIAL